MFVFNKSDKQVIETRYLNSIKAFLNILAFKDLERHSSHISDSEFPLF